MCLLPTSYLQSMTYTVKCNRDRQCVFFVHQIYSQSHIQSNAVVCRCFATKDSVSPLQLESITLNLVKERMQFVMQGQTMSLLEYFKPEKNYGQSHSQYSNMQPTAWGAETCNTSLFTCSQHTHILQGPIISKGYRLVGLVSKASALRAEDPEVWFSLVQWGFFLVELYQWLKNWHSSGYPARCLACVYCDWVR